MQKARRHQINWLRPLVSVRFQELFHSSSEVLFTFPSRYQFTIGLSVVFSLTGWSRLIHTKFLEFRATQDTCKIYNKYVYGTITLYGYAFQNDSTSYYISMSKSYNPNIAETILVWASPFSIASTGGITIVFFSSGYLDVSVHRVCLLINQNNNASHCWVAPFGNLRIKGYLHLT